MQKQKLEKEIRDLSRSGENYWMGGIILATVALSIAAIAYKREINVMCVLLVLEVGFISIGAITLFLTGIDQYTQIASKRKLLERLETAELVKAQLREEAAALEEKVKPECKGIAACAQ